MSKTGIFVLVIFLLIIGLTIFAAMNPNEPKTSTELSVLQTYMNDDQINNFKNIISQCGIDIDNIVRDDSLDGLDGENTIGFRIQNNISKNIILYLTTDGNVKSIRFADNYLYNDGEYINNLKNY